MEVKSARKIYNDIWNYHKKYLNVQNDERFLKSMISDKDALLHQYKDNPFAQEMIFVVFKSLLTSWKERFSK